MSMAEKLPILKGILNGVVQYHNAPVRFGRVPKREKARILAAMQQSTNSRSQEKALSVELEDDERLLSTVIRAHMETCDFTRDKVAPLLLKARTHPSFTACPPTLACPLNPNPQPLTGQQELLQDFSKRFSPAIRGVVEFAKRITGFHLLPQDDQVTLLKAGVFEVLLVRLACMFDTHNNTMICLNGQVLKRDSIHNSSNARFLMDSMFDFAERLNTLHLSDAEIALFSSVVVIAPDRPGLRNVELIEKMHNRLRALLQTVLSQNHPTQPSLCQELIKKIPDLRTLNTLHSEKLLAFKMTEQQLQMQQQQQNQHQNLWNTIKIKDEYKSEECESKSPVGSSSWSSSSEGAMEEVKSPMGSVSSTESMCSGEVASLNEAAANHNHSVIQSSHAASAPLLAATLANGICPMRRRDNSGSDDDVHGNIHMMPISKPPIIMNGCHKGFRKVDSPSDSGIESGTEKIEKHPNSAPTSVCSSPRSSSEDKDDHHHHNPHIIITRENGHSQMNGHYNSNNSNHSIIEDMPVLKRVLQAPPLYDTSSLMDEAYKPHKKFRALRNKDSAEAEPVIINTTTLRRSPTVSNGIRGIPSPGPSGASANSTAAINGYTNSSSSPSPHLQHHLTSSLSSTHSTLAKSLMEGPRMTPEQMKRTDIIHSFIMRGADTPLHEQLSSTNRSSPSPNYYIPSHHLSPQPQHSPAHHPKWEQPSVITSSGRSPLSSPYSYTGRSQSISPPGSHLGVPDHHQPSSRIFLKTPPACSPPMHYMSHISPASSPPRSMLSPNHLVNLQVSSALSTASSQQPLNLSKKTPPSSPHPLTTTSSTTGPKIVSMEA